MKKIIITSIFAIIIGTLFTTRIAMASTILKVGSYGTEVKTVQIQLKTLGYNAGVADGIFGQRTKAAVMSFQADYGLAVDGIVGPATSQALSRSAARVNKTNGILATAKSYIGVPYRWGGTTPSGFDCSGYTSYVFAKYGITLPRISTDQYRTGKPVAFSSLIPGDLVFFSLNGSGSVSHVGIFIGNGQFIHASTSKGVIISSFTSYWKNVYVGARRVY